MAGKRTRSQQKSDAAAKAVATINKEIRDQLSSNATAGNKPSPSLKPIDTEAAKSSNKKVKSAASPWYGGSWKAKASPVATVAKESISVSAGATSESLPSPAAGSAKSAAPYPYMTSGSSKSVPLVAGPTKLNAKGINDHDKSPEIAPKPTDDKHWAASDQKDGSGPPPPADDDPAQAQAKPWFGWWSRPDGYANSNPEIQPPPKRSLDPAPHTTPVPPPPKLVPQSSKPESNRKTSAPDTLSPQVEKPPPRDTPSRSWFRLWSASQNEQAQQADQDHSAPPVAAINSTNAATNERPRTPNVPIDRPKTPNTTGDRPKTPQTAAKSINSNGTPARPSTGWAFWSSDKGEHTQPPTDGTQKHLGELAVADTPSQSHPEAAQFNEQGRPKSKQSILTTNRKDSSQPSTISIPLEAAPAKTATTSATSKKDKPKSEAARLAAATQALQSKLKGPPNYILPSFESTYPPASTPSYFERIGRYFASSLRLSDSHTPSSHVCVSPKLPKVKNAIAIGVHGYFPAAIIQKVLGQPTGTSIRFANYAADSIRWWSEQHQPDTTCEIEQIALEGEGLIADRVHTLWKLLLNWLSHLRKADLILVACHSQGVPVSVMLVAKLIELGCLGSNVRIGICAMAGVNLGPFIDFKSKFFGGSAAELFEFASPDSAVSREYAGSLDIILRHGVRVTYIGSLDDQLVSLEVCLTC